MSGVSLRPPAAPHRHQAGGRHHEASTGELKRDRRITIDYGHGDQRNRHQCPYQPKEQLKRINVIPDLIPEANIFASFPECLAWVKDQFQNNHALAEKGGKIKN